MRIASQHLHGLGDMVPTAAMYPIEQNSVLQYAAGGITQSGGITGLSGFGDSTGLFDTGLFTGGWDLSTWGWGEWGVAAIGGYLVLSILGDIMGGAKAVSGVSRKRASKKKKAAETAAKRASLQSKLALL